MKLLIGGKNRNIYKRKDGSAYYKSGGQQVDVTYMFKKKGGGLKKKYIKGGMTEQEFKDLKQKCIELNTKLKALHDELESHTFNNDKEGGKIKSNDFIETKLKQYCEGDKALSRLAGEINEIIKKNKTNQDQDKDTENNYTKLIIALQKFESKIKYLVDGEMGPKIKTHLKSISITIDKKVFDTLKGVIVEKLLNLNNSFKKIEKIDAEPITLDFDEEEIQETTDDLDIKGITFDPIKINSGETDKKKALKQICCLALYGLAAGMTDGLNVETSENNDNKDKIKVLNKIKNKKEFITHLKQSYDLSIDEKSTVEDINREIEQFGFLNYNDSDGDGVFVTRAYILNKILQCFEGEDYIASSKKNVKRTNKKLLLNGKKILIDPATGIIMKSTEGEYLLQLFNNIHTIVELTNDDSDDSDDKIDISFNNLYYVLFSEEDIGSSQTVTEEANPEQKKKPFNKKFNETINQLVEEKKELKKELKKENTLPNLNRLPTAQPYHRGNGP